MILLTCFCLGLPMLAYPLAAELELPPARAAYHDFHSSLTEARYNAKTGKLECISRFFQDDFELAIRKHSLQSHFVLQTGPKENPLYAAYLKTHLKIKQGTQIAEIQMIGSELEEDVILLYYEIPVQIQKPVQITFSALTELFPDQIDFFYLFVGSEKKVFQFGKSHTQEEFYIE
mgnify:CR=1 FL=1